MRVCVFERQANGSDMGSLLCVCAKEEYPLRIITMQQHDAQPSCWTSLGPDGREPPQISQGSSDDTDDLCKICYAHPLDRDAVRLRCGHRMCGGCYERGFIRPPDPHTRCPFCRTPILAAPPKAASQTGVARSDAIPQHRPWDIGDVTESAARRAYFTLVYTRR